MVTAVDMASRWQLAKMVSMSCWSEVEKGTWVGKGCSYNRLLLLGYLEWVAKINDQVVIFMGAQEKKKTQQYLKIQIFQFLKIPKSNYYLKNK